MVEKSDKKVEPKMVRESDLLAVKKREEKLKDELTELKDEVANLTSALEVSRVNAEDDDEVKKVKDFLLKEEKRINQLQKELDGRETSFTEREKESRVQALASEYQIEVDALKEAEDPEKEALRIVNERLTKEKEGEPPETPGENAFENAPAGGVIKKPISAMTDEEFAKKEEEFKAEYRAKQIPK